MHRARFMLDDNGPYDGMMCFGQVGDGEVEFIAIALPQTPSTGFRIITIIPEAGEPFEAPVKRLVSVESHTETRRKLTSGYIVFEKV